jgi:polyribonucleotide nucleotidyltransferase
MTEYLRESATVGDKEIIVETGRMAKQASGSVVIQQGDTCVLVTAVGAGERPDLPFFPLICDYVEKTYAAGFIPGSFFRREGRLAEHEILSSRLIDRPVRPLFAEGYRGDTQIVATVVSSDKQNFADVLAITGASTALTISDIPWNGPVAAVRVGRVDGEFVANPTQDEVEVSDINIVVACSADAIVMVEGDTNGITEADMLDAFDFARSSAQRLLDLQNRLREVAGKEKRVVEPPTIDPAVMERVREQVEEPLSEALTIADKLARYKRLDEVKSELLEALDEEFPEREKEIKAAYDKIKKTTMRTMVATSERRIDGRTATEVRPITSEVSVLPRTHGSSLFTRGETQALVTCTFGTSRDEQKMETLMDPEEYRDFLLHYNFPPFSVGEVKMLRGPGRREIGHGVLARRSIEPVLPDKDEFPYTIRVVSEILESNGSSSMATVCGASLALMDAGVPIKQAVAGIAMGLIREGDNYVILTDILGDEDHLGDMDFKVSGTRDGINAIQMDTKIAGIPRDIMAAALEQARQGRLHILDAMAETLAQPRAEMSAHAPRIITIKIKPDRIRDVIGPGGKHIRGIVEATGVNINVEDDGSVQIASSDEDAAQKAIQMVRSLTMEPEVGAVYLGIVSKVVDFGAFITILPNLDGLCHISELSEERVEKTTDVLHEGDEVVVKCIGLERGGKIRLSRKEALGLKPTVNMVSA